LEQQIASIVSQQRLPDELVACDDGSSDNTLTILERFAKNSPFPITIFENETRLGSTRNFDRAIGLCDGDIIALCDQDDLWHTSKLGCVEQLFIDRPEVGAVFSDADVVDQSLNPLKFRLWTSVGFTRSEQGAVAHGLATEVLLKHNVATGATLAFRSEWKGLVLPIPREWWHDAWIALLISAVSHIAIIPAPLIQYRKHFDQQIGPLDHTLSRQLVVARATGKSQYQALADRLILARNRLLMFGKADKFGDAIPRFERQIRHIQTRARISSEGLTRVIDVIKELASGHYHRHSRGFRSAVKDLLL
jgi:glycosyltransferase involved in cell wall biosynthesis